MQLEQKKKTTASNHDHIKLQICIEGKLFKETQVMVVLSQDVFQLKTLAINITNM